MTVRDQISDHLFECEMGSPQCAGRSTGEGHRGVMFCLHCHRRCICPALRAYERRVQKNVIGAVSLGEIGKANAQAYDNGYSDGMQAAREAVAALLGWQHGIAVTAITKADALAAIDGLRRVEE